MQQGNLEHRVAALELLVDGLRLTVADLLKQQEDAWGEVDVAPARSLEEPVSTRLAREIHEKGAPEPMNARMRALASGLTGDACPSCGMFTMARAGACLVCTSCGTTDGGC